jgi:hypothetical protein
MIDIKWLTAMWVQQHITFQWVHASPPFGYTIGMWAHGLPELIVTGMGMEQSGMTLHLIAARMREHGTFKVGDIDTDLFTAPTKFGPVSERSIHRDMQRALDQLGPTTPKLPKPAVLQALWPDKRGIFPDEPGFSAEYVERQPVLA